MPRIRSIKPEFFTDENLCQLSPFHRLAFEGLWCYADKQGRLKDRPGYLKTMILPYDNVDFNSLLSDLSKTNSGRGQPLINRYSVGGDNYIQVVNFTEHQRPHHTEKDSILPVKPPLKDGYDTVKPRIKKVGKEGKGTVIGKEGKGKRKRVEYPAEFELLWKVHPKGGKINAFKAMEKLAPDQQEIGRWIEKLEAYKLSQQWVNGYAQNLSTWINGGFFDGEIPKDPPPPVDRSLETPFERYARIKGADPQ